MARWFSIQLFFLLFILSPLHSQQGWRRLTTEDGLNNNKILSIYQATNGHIWIGTDQGITRYNGLFEESSLSASINRILELPSGQILSREADVNNSISINLFDGLAWDEPNFLSDNDIILSDVPEFAVLSDGKVWISTRDGLVGFDGQKWQLYDTDVGTDWLVKTPDGRLWSESGDMDWIASFDGQKWIPEFNTDNSLLDSPTTNTALVTSTGQILLGTDQGLFQYDPVLNSITDLQLGQVNVKLIYETTDQSLWVATDRGLFNFADGKWQESITDQTIYAIQQTDRGQLWLATSNGLYHFHHGEWISELDIAVNSFLELTDGTLLAGSSDGLRLKPPADETGVRRTELAGELVGGLFLASDGKLWVRSTAGFISYDGLKWTNHGAPDMLKLKGQRNIQHSFGSNIYEDSKGTIWFNNRIDSGANAFSFSDGQLQPHNFRVGFTWGFAETEQGHIWVTGQSGGPYVYDGNSEGKWTRLSGYGTDANADRRSFAVFRDNDGSIWFNGGAGIWRYHNGQWVESRDIESKPVPYGGQFIRSPDGILRAATGEGIYRLNSDQKWVVEWKGKYIYSIHVLADGQLVALEVSRGLLINQGKTWVEHASFGGGRTYRDHFANGFVEHPEGVYWLATNRGLRRIQGDFWYDLTVADGLPSNDVYTIELDNSANLWVGTAEGITHLRPSSNPNPPAVQLTRIDGDDIPDDRTYQTGRAFVAIDWRGGDIETDSGHLHYQYNLDGRWSEKTKQNTATIGLENGQHQFSVRAIDHHFNASPLESLAIIVKTEAPDPNINFPTNGDVLRGQVYIKGNIIDNDFADYRVFITEANRDKMPIETETEKPIFVADALPRTTTLAIWKTEDFADKDYKIWLLAQDELEHKNYTKVTVRVDNTLPTVEILAPKANQRVLKQVTISAVTSDMNLDSYRLEFSTDSRGKSWEQIYLQAGLYQKSEDGLLPKTELKTVEINRDWEILILGGSVWIRLTATDIAGNTSSQTLQIEVPTAVVTREGGTISPQDQQAELYFPPNTLSQDEIVTVNALPEVEIEPPVRRVSQIYDFAPATLRLNAIKPATLIPTYDPSQLSAGKEPVIFHRTDGAWKAVGGTPNPEQQTISAAVLSLGQYTLGEMDKIQALDSANLKPDSLTCQPRVFSPKGNSFSTHTTISFTLAQPANVTIKVYNVAGQLVEWLVQQQTVRLRQTGHSVVGSR